MKKSTKKLVSVLLASAMAAGMLAGCGSGNGNGSTGDSKSSSAVSGTSGDNLNADTSEHVDLTMYLIGDRTPDFDEVYAKINEILEEKLNCSLNVEFLSWGEHDTKYSLLFSSQEDFDLIFTASSWCHYEQTVSLEFPCRRKDGKEIVCMINASRIGETLKDKQIVITSDVPPNRLNGFEERMLSRFNSGVTASIDRPNLETRIAILEKKASTDGIQVPREVHEYIASNMTTNIREMEGALRRVTAFADFNKQPADLTLAEIVLKDFISNPDTIEITASLIMGQTASYFQVSIDDLKSADRSRSLVTPRQIAMYLCREMTSLSLPKIGDIFGGRDHTTVMHAYKKIDKQMAEKQTTYNQVSELTSRIKQAGAQHS